MRLDKFILLPGYSAERILISDAIEQIAGSACIAGELCEQLQPRPKLLFYSSSERESGSWERG